MIIADTTEKNKRFDVGEIPAELRERDQWICWRLSDGKKLPINATTLRNASSTDPATWTTFDKSLESFRKNQKTLSGIGFVFSAEDPFCGVDLDGCRDPKTGIVAQWANDIIQRIGSYAEVSPSETGVKIFCRASNPFGRGRKIQVAEAECCDKEPAIECYDEGRYFAVTGNQLDGFGSIVAADLSWLTKFEPPKAIAAQSVPRDNPIDVIERARKYLFKIPPAVSGTAGHNATFNAACVLVLGFGLTEFESLSLLKEWNQSCVPPWTDKDLVHKIKSAANQSGERNYLRNAEEKTWAAICVPPYKETNAKSARVKIDDDETSADRFDLRFDSGRTDAANARRFIDAYHDQLLFVPPWRKCLTWDGRRWIDDNGIGVMRLATRYAKSLWQSLMDLAPDVDRDTLGVVKTFCKSSNDRRRIADFIKLAECDERVVCQVDQLNRDPYFLNCANGTVDLRTGKLRPHDPSDRITQLAPVQFDPNATCDQWLATLNLIFGNDAELIRYVQQLLGYSISGDAGEHILPIAFGSGCNGKSTIWNAVVAILGDYGTLASESLLLGDGDGGGCEVADLYQRRLVAIAEPERNAQLKESRVKALTGDAVIKARRLYENPWQFRRTHTFWLSTNHRPRINGTDDGIWRRVKLIPFAVDLRDKIKPDPKHVEKLIADEGAGIMAWLVRGFADWQANGFIEPDCVRAATAEYRTDSDPLADFIADHCVVESGAVVTASELFIAYQSSGGQWKQSSFGRAMAERFQKDKPTAGDYRRKTIYRGVRLLNESDRIDQISDPQKTSVKQALSPVVTSQTKTPIEFGKSYGTLLSTGDKWCQNGSQTCPKCSNPMTPTPAENGLTDWDCHPCGTVGRPTRELAAK